MANESRDTTGESCDITPRWSSVETWRVADESCDTTGESCDVARWSSNL